MLENHSNVRNSFNTKKSLKYSKIIEIHENRANNRKSSKTRNSLKLIQYSQTIQILENY